LEDQKGGMASPEEISPLKGRAVRKNRLTVMILGSVGRVLSFQISSGFFIGSIIFLIGYIAFSLFILNRYTQLRSNSTQNLEKYARLEDENSAAKRTISKSRQQIALLEGYIRHIEEGAEGFTGPGKKDQSRGTGDKMPLQAALPEKTFKGPQTVDVTDMLIQREGSGMSINLKLVNVQAGEGAVGGYIHLIATDRRPVPPKEWPYPQQKLDKGIPVNFKKGQVFLIQKFKQIQVKLHLGSPSESPSAIKVLVYDQSGEIILQKEMEVNH
jgi:hypothetical protein